MSRDTAALEAIRRRLAVGAMRATTKAGSGHPSTCLSASHLVTALYFGDLLRFDPERPDWPDRDRFVLSKGHAAPILYAALIEAGALHEDLQSLREIDSPLEGHPNARRVAAVEASTGSLGQGLSIALGMALAARIQGRAFRAVALLGDGEIDEGQVWEAAMAAAKYDADNLVAIVDRNGWQQTGRAVDVMPTDDLVAKWRAFGWRAVAIDGHDWDAVLGALDDALEPRGMPAVIVAHTQKGYGVPTILADDGNRMHGVPLPPDKLDQAIAEVMGA